MFLPIGDINPCRRTPVLNWGLIAANVLVFFLFGLSGGQYYAQVVQAYGFIPSRFAAEHDLLTMFTSMFLHGDMWHLAGNMLFLWICGDNVEDMLGWFGYLCFYLACGLAAGFGHMAIAAGSSVPCIGASGAISGVLGAYVLFFPQSRIKVLYFFNLWWSGIWLLPAWGAIGFWFLEQAIFTALSVGGDQTTGVAYAAHVGGFALGAVVAVALRGGGLVRPPVVRMEPYYQRRATPYDRSW